MFGKKPPPSAEMLDRVRKLGERPAPTAYTPPKRERAARQSVFRQATLIFDSGERFGVAVKDVSEMGARIEYMINTILPNEFLFVEPTMRIRRRVRVVWQREGIAGLRFV